MPNFLPRACEQPGGCPNHALPGRRKCSEHDDSKERNRQRMQDSFFDARNTAQWKRTSTALRKHNVFCQKLTEGQPCRNHSELVHHVHGRSRPDLTFAIYDPATGKSNLICLCRTHHPDTETTDWVEGKDFSRTQYTLAMLGQSPAEVEPRS